MHPFLLKHAVKSKQAVVAFSILVSCCLTYYFHAVLGLGTIVSHFYYIPIILACIWWQRKGIWVAVFLVAFLLVSHQLFKPQATPATVFMRVFMLMLIAMVVAWLSERIAASESKLRNAHAQMEKQVVKRTEQLAKSNRDLELEIEQHKRTEERLALSASRLEQRNEEIKNFAYIVSHDLRAPLINLKGFSAELRNAMEILHPVLKDHLPRLDQKEQTTVTNALMDIDESLDFIVSSTTRMDSLINAILQLSRLGRFELKPEPIDMNKKVQDTLDTLAHQLYTKQIEVKINPLPTIEADQLAMQQILGNLLNNAVLYSVPGRKGKIEITCKTGLDQMTFYVKDNGTGIAPEDMHKIFMPFRRAGKGDVPGEGMGLAYAQALINRHGGHIQCHSKLGEGSVFSFTLPVAGSTHEETI
jgi:signal transduction histidine kinase